MARMRHFLKRCPAVLLSAALLAAAAGTAAAADTPAPTLGIYTTGDMGGRLYREDPVTGEAVEYSYQNVASAMEAERASVDAALLLDSGDAVDNGLVQDGGAAEALALRAIGYDALVPAVGEFRLGPEARDDFFAALGEASEDGAPVRVLSGNYLDEDTQSPEEDAYEVFTVVASTPVMVVCAGAKSILDLGLTLEYLETHGVPVLGYGTKELPAFYTRKSGFEVDYRVDTPAELAAAFRASLDLGLRGGMLVTNPIPEEFAMDHEVINRAIDEAVAQANAQGIHGKATTPFLLAKVKELTGGDSLDSNIQLVFNNARLAAQTAAELCRLG